MQDEQHPMPHSQQVANPSTNSYPIKFNYQLLLEQLKSNQYIPNASIEITQVTGKGFPTNHKNGPPSDKLPTSKP
jgi:hypothetical protein